MTLKTGPHKVLVTGATGFIGRCCLTPLTQSGFEVHAVSSQTVTAQEGASVQWHQLDLLDASGPAAFLDDLKPSHLLHLAWFAKPGLFWSSEENFRWLTASTELFRAFYANGGKRAVGAGTCAEYQWVMDDYDEERTPLQPETLYGKCKLETSLVLSATANLSGQSAGWARIFFPYGPGEPEERFIPAVVRGLLNGETVACTHGNQIRDFIHVDDVARALVVLLSSDAAGAFNIGTGRSTSLQEIAALISSRLGHAELIRFGARPTSAGDPQRVVANMNKLKSATGWQPSVSLEQGIDNTIAAWRDRLHLLEK